MLKLAYKVGSRGGAMVSTSAQNAGDPWFESQTRYDRFLYVNIQWFIYIQVIQYVFLIICESSETAVEALKYSVYWTLE